MVFVALLLLSVAIVPAAQRDNAPRQLDSPASRDVRRMEALKEEIRHQLVMLPYYSVFDWLQAEAQPDGTVILIVIRCHSHLRRTPSSERPGRCRE